MSKIKAVGVLLGVFTVGTVLVALACKYVQFVFSLLFWVKTKT